MIVTISICKGHYIDCVYCSMFMVIQELLGRFKRLIYSWSQL